MPNKKILLRQENIFSAEVKHKNVLLSIKIDENWFIDMTQLGKDLNKPWRKWKFNNKKVIEVFELLEEKKLTKQIGTINKQHTWVSLVLALRALADYDHVLSYHVFKKYEQSLISSKEQYLDEIKKLEQQLEVGEALLAVAQGRKIEPVLLNHDFLAYAYECNGHCKFGNSFVNSNGQRPKSHKTSVPNLAIGYLIYSSKEHLQELNVAIKKSFKIKGAAAEHAPCKIEELRSFVYDFMRIMKYPYVEEDIHQLKLLNIFLK
jgi:hypothetical protein